MKRSLLLTALLFCFAAQSQDNFQFNHSANRFKGHRTSVGNLAYSKDGSFLATVGGKNQAIVFNANSGEIISKSKEYELPLNFCALSDDGSMLAVGGYGKGSMYILNPQTGEEKLTIPLNGGVFGLDFSPKTNDIAVLATDNQKQTIRIYNSSTGELVREIFKEEEDKTFPTTIAFSPSGGNIACGISNANHGIRIYDVINGYLLETIKHSDDITNIDWSPDGKQIAGGGTDKNVYIWNTHGGAKVQTLTGYDGYVSTVDYSPDGSKVVAAGMGRGHRFMMWDTKTGKLLQDVEGRGADVNCLDFSPDGLSLAMGLQTYGDAFDVATVLIYRTGDAVNAMPWYHHASTKVELDFPVAPEVKTKSDGYYEYEDIDLTEGYFVYTYYGIRYKTPVDQSRKTKAINDRIAYNTSGAEKLEQTTFTVDGVTGTDLLFYKGTARYHYRLIFIGDVFHQWLFSARNKASCPEEERYLASFKVPNGGGTSTNNSSNSSSISPSNSTTSGDFKVNEKVMANWQYTGKYWPGKITRIANGKYYVEYDDSGVEWCKKDQLKKWGSNTTTTTTNSSSSKLQIGDRVEGNWKGQGKYYPGKIAKIAGGKYYIEYDDGDVEWTTKDRIRKK